MKTLFFVLSFMMSFTISAQERIKLQTEEKTISRHELGINFNSYTSNLAFVPELSYNYYRRENHILHFIASGAINGGFYRAIGFEFWNEKRKYFGERQKWFLSHGFTLRASYSKIDFSSLLQPREDYIGVSAGFGYNIGGGFKVNDHLNFTATYKPTINYVQTNSDVFKSGMKLNSSFSLGVNYRF